MQQVFIKIRTSTWNSSEDKLLGSLVLGSLILTILTLVATIFLAVKAAIQSYQEKKRGNYLQKHQKKEDKVTGEEAGGAPESQAEKAAEEL